MRKKEQTGINLSEEEILHGKEDAYGIYQIDWKGEGREYKERIIVKNGYIYRNEFIF